MSGASSVLMVDRASVALDGKAGPAASMPASAAGAIAIVVPVVHEPPDMSPANDQAIAPGNVFTIEPGIYLPGRGGVRIEDNVVATADGGRTMTSYSRDLMTVG